MFGKKNEQEKTTKPVAIPLSRASVMSLGAVSLASFCFPAPNSCPKMIAKAEPKDIHKTEAVSLKVLEMFKAEMPASPRSE